MNRYLTIGIILNILVIVYCPFANKIANSNKKRRTILSTLLMIIVASIGTVFCVAGLVLYIIERGGTIL